MHLYNAWLPPPVAEATKGEKESFALVVKSVKDYWSPEDPESVYATIKWLSVADAFLRAKSDLALEDVEALVELGLEIFRNSDSKLYAQVRWGNVISRFLNKYSKKLSLTVQWRPLYDTLIHTHFTRSTGPEGWRLRQRHFETITSLVRSCRQLFPQGAALEIWTEFKSLLENPWHNSSFEGSGFLRLFLPTNKDNQDFFTQDIIEKFVKHWDMIPNCQFWNSQWTDIISRIIKKSHSIDWEKYLPGLFTRFLNMFEVPVANGSGSYPFPVDVPRNTRFLFSNRSVTPSKAIAKSIVFLLKPGPSGQKHLEKLVNLLEQYYHPSNGGRWTYSLERFLFYLVLSFQKRLLSEKRSIEENGQSDFFLGRSDISSFVSVLLRLVDRGQYSKNEHLSETVAAATSFLSYLEPSLVFPFVATRFNMALETMTATHQLKTAVTSVAYTGRSLFLSALSDSSMKSDYLGWFDVNIDLLMMSLSNALLGMDANDPPKTLATMQLIGSLFSNMASLDDNLDSMPGVQFSEWLDEFFCRLFSLLQHLEPNSVLNEGHHSASTSGTFLVEEGPYYFCMLEVLLGRLSKPLYSQALKKICKFVHSNILPGAVAEVGLLCCACVHSNPEEAAVHLIGPLITSVMSSLKETPTTGFGGTQSFEPSVSVPYPYKTRQMLSPALETAIDYQLKVLSVAISYGGAALLPYMSQFKETIYSAFNSTSWKVNGAGDHLLRSLLGSLTLYYPIDQYKCLTPHSDAPSLEGWISAKDFSVDDPPMSSKWHLPCKEEIVFANELLDLHFQSALADLSNACHSKIHSDTGMEKEHLKVILLRIDSALQGVLSCLPDFKPSVQSTVGDKSHNIPFLIAGASGTTVGSVGMREKAAEIVHSACKYLLEEKSDDSILLILLIRIVDALSNYGSLEYDEWLNHRQAWKLESAAIVEPPINLIVSSHTKGKKRPRWALVDKAHMHNTWRASQSSYHLFRMTNDYSPSDQLSLLMDDLLKLSLHRYETVRLFAGKSLLKMIKRWPSMISKCVITLTENLRDPNAPEYAVLGSCAVLSTQTVLKYLTTDATAFSSFLLGILSSSHHETLKCQKAINELFIKYNIHFAGVSRRIFKKLDSKSDGPNFSELVSQIGRLSYDSSGLHWRYNLMANRVLLLLAMASRNDPNYLAVRQETAGHFLTNLKSQLPQTRILAISALNTLLKESPYKLPSELLPVASIDMEAADKSSLEGALSQIFLQEGFFEETFNSLSHVHITSDTEGASSRGNGNSSIQSVADKSITRFYFDFLASWPRTPSWISLMGSDTFYSSFARIFKRLVQECGMPVLSALKKSLVEFMNSEERSKQCVAAEVLAGVLHSDVNGLLEAWDSWMLDVVKNVISVPSVESTAEWAACIRYAVTGKGKQGTKVPILRPHILNCLMAPLPSTVTTTVVAKRYTFLSAALIEISPQRMPPSEIELHQILLEELLENMSHSSAQVRETIGVALSVLCSNIRLLVSFSNDRSNNMDIVTEGNLTKDEIWARHLTERADDLVKSIQRASNQSDNMEIHTSGDPVSNGHTEDDGKWMETLFHFMISSMKSGRSSYMLDILVALLYPVIALQEISNKDLSTLAKAAFELFKWRVLWGPDLQKTVSVVLASASNSNWRTRSATLTYLRTFMYRHTFTLSNSEKQQIWKAVESLLTDSQVEVREHAAAVLAGLMKGGDEELARDFRVRAYTEASNILQRRKQRKFHSNQNVASVHGAVLALAASVLSVPYDMPSWLPDHVTLLARFVGESSPVKSTVTKAVAEFRRTHADTWSVQKDSFSEEQLEVLADTSSSSSYFA